MNGQDILTTPIGFVEGYLGLSLYPWQDKALAPLERAGWDKPIVQISVLAPNEGGKSSRIVAGSALYWCSVHTKGKVAITTRDQKQLNEQIIPAIEAQLSKLGGYRSVRSPYYRVTTPTGGIIIAYTTDDAARVEGFHGSPESPLLEIVDEAKSVAEPIFQGIDRCGYQALIYCSSGGLMQGTFYDSQTKNRAAFHCVAAGLKDCPHIPTAKIKRIIDKYGEEHPFTRSSVYGEFMEQDEMDSFVVPLSTLNACIASPPNHRQGIQTGFCDFGAGKAENVFALRNGNKVEITSAWRDANKKAAAFRFVSEFRKSGLKEDQIWGDAADKEMIDLLLQNGWTINSQNFGAPAMNSEVYQSWGAEAWWETGLSILKGEVILPDDDILIAQLTSRKKTITARGKLGVEEKHDMMKRNIPSPDRGDAVCGVLAVYDPSMLLQKEPIDMSRWRDGAGLDGDHQELEEMGAFAGY